MNYAFLGWLGAIMTVGVFLVNGLIALAVFRDAVKIASKPEKELKIFPPMSWAFVCFFGSIPALALYAFLHHTSFSK